jgi:hypothetical protein
MESIKNICAMELVQYSIMLNYVILHDQKMYLSIVIFNILLYNLQMYYNLIIYILYVYLLRIYNKNQYILFIFIVLNNYIVTNYNMLMINDLIYIFIIITKNKLFKCIEFVYGIVNKWTSCYLTNKKLNQSSRMMKS